MKKWLSRLTKIAFILFAFLAVVVTVLFNMGGSSDTLKGAVEDYIGQSTGYAAQIQTFNKMTFFPDISIDMEGISLKKPNMTAMNAWAKAESKKPKEEQGKTAPPINYSNPDSQIAQFKISIGFWDVGFGKTRKIRDLQMRDANFKAGSIAHKEVTIGILGIDETADGNPFLNMEGQWGSEAFRVTLDLESSGSRKKRKYYIGEESLFEAEIGKITMQGIARPRTMGGFHIRDLTIYHQGSEVLKTTLSFVKDAENAMSLKGDFLASENGSDGEFDLKIHAAQNMTISGMIDAETFNLNDFKAGSKFSRAWAEWDRIFKDQSQPVNDNHKITVTAKDYQGSAFNGTAIIDKNQITLKAAQE